MTGDPSCMGAGEACHLEEKVIPGPPQPAGGDDDDDLVLLILPDLDQLLLEKRDRGEGVE